MSGNIYTVFLVAGLLFAGSDLALGQSSSTVNSRYGYDRPGGQARCFSRELARQAARRMRIQNDVLATRAFYDKRRIRRDYLNEQKHRLTAADVVAAREHYDALGAIIRIKHDWIADRARRAGPGRTSATELDPVTGRITWPSALKQTNFAAARHRLETLFAQRGYGNADGASQDGEMLAVIQHMKESLKERIDQLPCDRYLAAKRFLGRLDYETRFSPAAAGLALSGTD